MESGLDLGVVGDQSVDLRLQETVSHLMSQDYFTHVDVLLVQSIAQLDALQFVGALLSLLDEPVAVPHVTDLLGVVLILFLSSLGAVHIGLSI